MSKAELALPFQEAVAELQRCVGTQLDPRVVEALAGAIGADRRVETRAA